MSSTIQDRVLAATVSCLRPLVRVLLGSGINYRQFAEAAKVAFLQEAVRNSSGGEKKTNISRLAVRTGLSRKEVARVRDGHTSYGGSMGAMSGDIENAGIAARVLQLWYSDRRYVSELGEPKELSFAAGTNCFTSLVKLVGGDVPPGAVRAELLAAGSVVESEDGSLRAVRRYFVPGNVGEDVVIGLTQIVQPVMEGLARNTITHKANPFVQRLAYSERLRPSAYLAFKDVASERCARFVQSIDDWLCQNEIPPEDASNTRRRVGVGVFYFEAPIQDGIGASDNGSNGSIEQRTQ
jgi:hypothetical protein